MITTFTPVAAILGGSLIGLSAVLLMAFNGRTLGMTGILAGLMQPEGRSDLVWRLALVAGMIASPLLLWLVTGNLPEVVNETAPAELIIGALLVGIGVTYGSGCTSGHGVCGLARFSRRSLVAVPVFLVAAVITVYIRRHLVGV